ncbi:hypothetical protein OG746_09360 [Streptomyces sp. NBC_01016]|uniref:hypothetical protein n=1 Tax=Streptomyces sp. NBC_01016 TaxID=2903720 RepID=UPI00224EEE4B|nr:hypothetical protein [Streptomyces sp. NBC_01016]MCX4828933.1 hypothetical protein [Streptomyces sp. NBC_01016]
MADEHDKWLNRDAADRLLRGEAPAVSGDDALRADRLTAALYALAEVPAGPEGELPGEDAALKAFRETRAVAAVNGAVNGAVNSPARAGRARRSTRSAPKTSGQRSFWGRPARFGAVAAFAVCMVGGVAVAAGTGVLPSPFRESDDPAPASSVSAAASPDRPLASSSAGVTEDGHAVPSPTKPPGTSGSGSASGSPSHRHGAGEPREGRPPQGRGPGPNATGPDGARAQARKLVDTCRKYRGGESGSVDVRRLEASAKALGQDTRSLDRFCDRVLARAGAPTAPADRTASQHTDNKSDSGSQSASDDGNGRPGGKGGGERGGDNEDEDGDPDGGASPSPSVSSGPSPSGSASPSLSPTP